MDCPRCHRPTRTLETRRVEDGAAVRRRRRCTECGHRFTTYERRQRDPVFVRKRGGERQRFDRTKLRAALLRAAHKRPVAPDDVEALVDRVEVAIEAAGGELEADRIAELCLQGLAELDRGAYLQFAGTLPSPTAEFAELTDGGSVRAAREHVKFPARAKT
jgi:transcriptional repressor NrdR